MEDDKVLAELLDKIDNLKELMSNGFVKFSFKKADGTIREATGTLSPSYINYHTFREKEANQTAGRSFPHFRRKSVDQLSFFDVDAQDWRSMNIHRFIEIIDISM